jgi:hypothetical protein
MKKLLLVLIVACFAINSWAQNEKSEHLNFKGVPIDGKLSDYVLKMQKSGFTNLGIENGVAYLKGDFAGYKECVVGVSTLKQKDLVSKISVTFPEQENWSALSNDYFSLKEMLTEKYGKPSENVEMFQSRIQPEDDPSKMHEVMFDKCKYYSIFITDKGRIELSIFGSIDSSYVLLTYYDKINSEIIRATAIDDL